MENKIDIKVNWNYIFIFEELTAYFSINFLKELSLCSKLIRSRLRPVLFAESALSSKKANECFNINNFDSMQLKNIENLSRYNVDGNTSFNLLNNLIDILPDTIEPLYVNMGLERELNGIGPYIKSFKLKGLKHFCSVSFPFTIALTNLGQLEFSDCILPLLNFLKITGNLKNLKKLTLYSVKFVDKGKHEISPDIPHFPTALEELVVYDFSLPLSNSDISAINLVESDLNSHLTQFKHLKWLNIPSLKKVKSFGYNYPRNLLEILLIFNPQVESLRISNYLESQRVYNQVSVSKNLTQLEILSTNLAFPHISEDQNFIFPQFTYVKSLKIGFEVNEYSNNGSFQNIVKYFPDLRHLKLDISGFEYEDRNINDLFRLNFPFCSRLDSATLKAFGSSSEVCNYYEHKLDCESFINVKCLILNIPLLPLSEIEFDMFPSDLKEVRKLYNNKLRQLQYIQENPNIFSKWNIAFEGKYIYFSK
jgi:hypothetical protein